MSSRDRQLDRSSEESSLCVRVSFEAPADYSRAKVEVPLVYQRKKGLRRLRMGFDYENRLIVSVPWNCPQREAEEFVRNHRGWVEEQAARLSPVLTLREHLSHCPTIAIGGQSVVVEVRNVASGRSQWIYDEKRGEGIFMIRAQSEGEDLPLRKLFRKVATIALSDRVGELAAVHGFNPGRVTVRDQKSRWGSCSRNRTISLNWRLLLFSPGAQDHVILHELAHLRHLDHSANFHRLLSELDPRRAEFEAELNRDGAQLMRVDR